MNRQQALKAIWTALTLDKIKEAFEICNDYNMNHSDEIFMEEDAEWIALEDDIYYFN